MKSRFYLLLVFVFTTFYIHAATVAPTSGPTAGQTDITITATGGDNFEAQGAMSSVLVGSNPAVVITTWNAGLIIFKLPAGVGTGLQVKVTTQSGAIIICSDLFDYNAPLLFSLSPSSGPAAGGTSVLATGNNFGPAGTSATVLIDGTPATNVVVTSHTSLTFISPPGAGTNNDVIITVAGQSGMAVPLWSYNAPIVYSALPTSGPTLGGTLVTLTGDNFGPPGTIASVTVGGSPGTSVTVISNTSLTFLSPAGTGTNKNIIVNIETQSSAPVPLWSYHPPVAIIPLPDSGTTSGGTFVTLTGSNFGPPGTPASVTIDGAPCTEVVVTGHTSLTFKTPAGLGINKNIIVTITGQSSAPAPLWSYDPPIVYAATPPIGPTPGGTFVTLTGNNFGPPGTLVTVTIDGVPCTSTVVIGQTLLSLTTPPGAGANQPIVVTVNGHTGPPAEIWDYTPPVLYSLSPSTGPANGGTIVSATGNNFGPPGTIIDVKVDGISSPQVTYSGHSALSFVTPAGSGAMNPVTITVDGQQSNSYNFTYLAPTVTHLDPNYGTENGGTPVRMIGENYGPPGSFIILMIDGIPVEDLLHVNDTLITFTTPPGTGSNLPVQITIDGQQVNPPPTFSYRVPEGVGIGTVSPHESAALDITSNTKGILIPRLTTTEREAIGLPVAGLLVYDSTLNAFFFFNGTVWKQLSME